MNVNMQKASQSGPRETYLKTLLTSMGAQMKIRHAPMTQLDGVISPCPTSCRKDKKQNVRKRRDRQSEANFKKPKRNYRQSNEDQIEPGNHQKEPSHNSKKSGQPQYHHQKSKTDSSFAEEVVLHVVESLAGIEKPKCCATALSERLWLKSGILVSTRVPDSAQDTSQFATELADAFPHTNYANAEARRMRITH
jgi:hypothetical protein